MFTDGLLKQKADLIALHITNRDSTEFASRNVIPATVTAFEALVTDFSDTPDDVILLGNISETTEDKDTKAEALRVAIRTYRSMAQNKWGESNPKYRKYGFERLNNTPDDSLFRLARTLLLLAPTHLAALADEGLTQLKIDNISALMGSFDLAIDVQGDAITEREVSKQDRIIKGNLVYKELSRLCNIGKDLYASTDEARYNDYIVYNTAAGLPPVSLETTGTVHGTMLNSETLDPVVNGLIFPEGIEDPIEADGDGGYEREPVSAGIYNFMATADNCKDYQGSVTIIAGQDIAMDIMMEPMDVVVPPIPGT